MTHALVFVLGVVTPWTARMVMEAARQLRELWVDLEYYERPGEYTGLTWAGRGALRVMRILKRGSR